MDDQSKFFNVIIDRTNQKLNSFQAQVIVLESQLQMAVDERDAYKQIVENTTGHTLNAADLEELKKEFLNMQAQLKETLEENTYLREKNTDLKTQVNHLESSFTDSTKFIKDQNETLLQEVRRLQRLVDELS